MKFQMDFTDFYYGDILDALSDDDQSSSSDEQETDEQLIADLHKHLSKKDRKILFEDTQECFNSDDIPNCVRMSKVKVKKSTNISFEDEMNNEIKSHIQTQFSQHFKRSTVEEKVPTIVDMKLFEPSTSRTQKDIDDELLYDPNADDEDEEWMHSKTSSQNIKNDTKKSKTSSCDKQNDTRLNCPGCMTLLCVDCQQHDIYEGQFRAMFVQNCRIDYKQRLTIRDKQDKRQKFRKSVQKRERDKNKSCKKPKLHQELPTENENETSNAQALTEPECNLYYPVHCSHCHTEVALYDCEEVYHFFSVISSS